MFKDAKTKKIALIVIGVLVLALIIWYFFIRKDKQIVINMPESSFDDGINPDSLNDAEETELKNMPGLLNLEYRISKYGKKNVFPMIIEKVTPGEIELPNRRSLLNKDAEYKFVDVLPGDKITIVYMQRLNYTIDHNAFTDVFLVTDKDNLIAVTQAKEHFKLVN